MLSVCAADPPDSPGATHDYVPGSSPNNVGATVSYACPEDGSTAYSTCQGDGTWSSVTASCPADTITSTTVAGTTTTAAGTTTTAAGTTTTAGITTTAGGTTTTAGGTTTTAAGTTTTAGITTTTVTTTDGYPVAEPNTGVPIALPDSESCIMVRSHDDYPFIPYAPNLEHEWSFLPSHSCEGVEIQFVGPIFNVHRIRKKKCRGGDKVIVRQKKSYRKYGLNKIICGIWSPFFQPNHNTLVTRRKAFPIEVIFKSNSKNEGRGFLANICSFGCL